MPNERRTHYVERRRSTNPDVYETIDSGKRYANFEFTKGFNHTVYVTTLIDLNTHGEQIKLMERNISEKTPISITLDNALHITLPITQNDL
ncbi:MAG: hypothetical protein QM500_11140 [Methylococcales bacterium]